MFLSVNFLKEIEIELFVDTLLNTDNKYNVKNVSSFLDNILIKLLFVKSSVKIISNQVDVCYRSYIVIKF